MLVFSSNRLPFLVLVRVLVVRSVFVYSAFGLFLYLHLMMILPDLLHAVGWLLFLVVVILPVWEVVLSCFAIYPLCGLVLVAFLCLRWVLVVVLVPVQLVTLVEMR